MQLTPSEKTLAIKADGPSEVHLPGIAKVELRNHDPKAFDKYYHIPAR